MSFSATAFCRLTRISPIYFRSIKKLNVRSKIFLPGLLVLWPVAKVCEREVDAIATLKKQVRKDARVNSYLKRCASQEFLSANRRRTRARKIWLNLRRPWTNRERDWVCAKPLDGRNGRSAQVILQNFVMSSLWIKIVEWNFKAINIFMFKATCGVGVTMRTRTFLDRVGRKKCSHITVGKPKCDLYPTYYGRRPINPFFFNASTLFSVSFRALNNQSRLM